MDVFSAHTPEYAKDLELPPKKQKGWVHEVEVPMRAGDMLHYESQHAGPGSRIEFNVHSHKGKEVTYHMKLSEALVVGAFTAPWEGKFYLMWENVSDAPVSVRIQARRHTVHAEPVAEHEGHDH